MDGFAAIVETEAERPASLMDMGANMAFVSRVAAAVSTLITVAGCGGGSGSGSVGDIVRLDDEPAGENCPAGGVAIRIGVDLNGNGVLDPDEITDTRYVCNGSDGAPVVLATRPWDGQVEVDRDASIEVLFSRPMGADSGAALTLVDSSGSVVAGATMVRGSIIEFQPEAPLDLAREYQLRIGVAALDQEGRPLEAEQMVTFRVREGVWQPSELLTSDATCAHPPRGALAPGVDMGPAGHAVVAWPDDAGALLAARYDPVAGWAPAEEVAATAPVHDLVVARIDAEGRSLVLWAAAEGVLVRRHVPGSGWSAILSMGAGTPLDVAMKATPDGRMIAAWMVHEAEPQSRLVLWRAEFDPNGGWGSPVAIDSVDARYCYPPGELTLPWDPIRLEVAPTGEALLSWGKVSDDDEFSCRRRNAILHRSPSGTWTGPDEPILLSRNAVIALGPEGRAILIEFTDAQARASLRTPEGVWDSPEAVLTDRYILNRDIAGLGVAFDIDGSIHFAYSEDNGLVLSCPWGHCTGTRLTSMLTRGQEGWGGRRSVSQAAHPLLNFPFVMGRHGNIMYLVRSGKWPEGPGASWQMRVPIAAARYDHARSLTTSSRVLVESSTWCRRLAINDRGEAIVLTSTDEGALHVHRFR
jgi:hypothetical protein